MRARRRWAATAASLVALALGAALLAGACGGSPLVSLPMPAVNSANDTAVTAGVRSIRLGVEAYAAENQKYPASATRALVGQYVGSWPKNPWTGADMTSGAGKGDFTYTLNADGSDYTLAAHLSDGTTQVIH